MTNKKEFIPVLGYDWLTGFYDLTIKLTMPEKKFRARLIDELKPMNDETILEFGLARDKIPSLDISVMQKPNLRARYRPESNKN
jgi:hypothetical protein